MKNDYTINTTRHISDNSILPSSATKMCELEKRLQQVQKENQKYKAKLARKSCFRRLLKKLWR